MPNYRYKNKHNNSVYESEVVSLWVLSRCRLDEMPPSGYELDIWLIKNGIDLKPFETLEVLFKNKLCIYMFSSGWMTLKMTRCTAAGQQVCRNFSEPPFLASSDRLDVISLTWWELIELCFSDVSLYKISINTDGRNARK